MFRGLRNGRHGTGRLILSACLGIISLSLPAGSRAAFQDLGWGARPYGMGGAFTALADDGNATFWNPAGLDQLERKELGLMYLKPYLGLEGVDWGALNLTFVHPVKRGKGGVLGFNATSFNMQDLYKEYTVSLSYARLISRTVHGGLTVKYLYHLYNWNDEIRSLGSPVVNAGDSQGKISFDLGALYKPGRFNFGVCLKNINQPDVGLYYEDKVPLELRAGLLYKFGDIKAFEDVVLAFDTSYRDQGWAKDTRRSYYLGAESWFKYHAFGLRSGINITGQDLNEATFGFSFNKPLGTASLLIDYSIAWPMTIKDTMGTHRISTGIRF